jgi:hypothetical protein
VESDVEPRSLTVWNIQNADFPHTGLALLITRKELNIFQFYDPYRHISRTTAELRGSDWDLVILRVGQSPLFWPRCWARKVWGEVQRWKWEHLRINASHVSEPAIMGLVYLLLNLAAYCCCTGGCDRQDREDEGTRANELKGFSMFVRPHSRVEC